jgi:hypothetical protein
MHACVSLGSQHAKRYASFRKLISDASLVRKFGDLNYWKSKGGNGPRLESALRQAVNVKA